MALTSTAACSRCSAQRPGTLVDVPDGAQRLPARANETGPAACVAIAGTRSYDVGDDRPYKTLADVPWTQLPPGATVRIHYRSKPYREKLLLTASGTTEDPIRVCGVAGPSGELPILDGDGATTASTLDFDGASAERRGLVTISKRKSDKEGTRPHHIIVEGLELRNAAIPLGFTDSSGKSAEYRDNAACIFVERGEHITLRGNDVHSCGNGIFVASGAEEATLSRDVLIEGNYVHACGTTDRRKDRHHNAYTEAFGIVYQFNRFGPVREGSDGIQLKDRSVGTVIRYNWFEGGRRVLDLVEPEESAVLAIKEPAFSKAFVYGNVMTLGKRASSRLVHYGGDNGNTATYRKGTLYFYDNTIALSTRASEQWNVALFNLETADETADVRNNIFYGAGDANLFWLFDRGVVELGANWASRAVKAALSSEGQVDHVLGSVMTTGGDDPGFVDIARGDFCLAPSSVARGIGGPLAPAVPPDLLPTLQYSKHQGRLPRAKSRDMGALGCD